MAGHDALVTAIQGAEEKRARAGLQDEESEGRGREGERSADGEGYLAIDQEKEDTRTAAVKEKQRQVDGKENIGNSIRSGATSRAPEYISSSRG
ncbi:hypothetical protein KM043_005313 [Ampulex compressa]|nr:hypothetical protein KM043_005313 [Ampulex compressa]